MEVEGDVAFQSLFFWKFHCNLNGRSETGNLAQGFNPCFSGSSTATMDLYDLANVSMEFQSLFFWKFHCNLDV